jgi:predicted RNA-binding Zn ribbon-like protein
MPAMIDLAEPPWIAAPSETLALDFANTRYWRHALVPTETLAGFGDVVAWCRDQAGLPAAQAASLENWAAAQGSEAIEAFAAALALRETLYRLFHAAAAKTAPAAADLDRLNRALREAPARQDLEATEAGFGWRVSRAATSAQALLAPVLWSAGDLLASRRLGRVRYCANPHCEWLFLDDSKSGNRRWCAMSACGNRAKAHRHYARKKETPP